MRGRPPAEGKRTARTALSFNGKDIWLSTRGSGFDSPWGRCTKTLGIKWVAPTAAPRRAGVTQLSHGRNGRRIP